MAIILALIGHISISLPFLTQFSLLFCCQLQFSFDFLRLFPLLISVIFIVCLISFVSCTCKCGFLVVYHIFFLVSSFLSFILACIFFYDSTLAYGYLLYTNFHCIYSCLSLFLRSIILLSFIFFFFSILYTLSSSLYFSRPFHLLSPILSLLLFPVLLDHFP